MRRHLAIVVAAAFVAFAGIALSGQSLPKLKDEIKIARSADSPGQVVFNHATHVDAAKPACATCHARDFSILGEQGGKRAAVLHKNFEAGRQCGRCHDGTHAFALDEDCTNCHQAE